jgi:phospho-N-acetylmuramoyl-pentapeptide-transferase
MILDITLLKVLFPSMLAFLYGILITPSVAGYLYKHKMWKKKNVQVATDGRPAPITQKLHNDEAVHVPRMGGVVVWGSVLLSAGSIWRLAHVFPGPVTEKFEFITRAQTWLPFFAFFVGAAVGLVDDIYAVTDKYDQKAGGLSAKKRLGIVAILGLVTGWWFFAKLGMTELFVPFFGMWEIGWFIIPLVILVMLGTYAGGVIDGIDGLSGGVFTAIYSAYGIIAFAQHQIDISAFCFVIVGGILAFLWFNVPPARFYLSDTGATALTLALGVVAFLTNQVLVLPIIAFPLVATAGSSALQLLSKKFRNGKKIFLVAPLHHHFQAIGWPACKVTMRYWILSVMFAVAGIIIALAG